MIFSLLTSGDQQAGDTTITTSENPGNLKPVSVAKAAANSAPDEPQEMHLVLRLRNDQRELHDIKFDFTVGKDTSESVSRELVEAGLVDGQDLIIMAANLDKIIEKREKQQVFRLNSGCGPNEAPCDKSLLGFAQLTLID